MLITLNCGVYEIRNLITDSCYIGSSSNIPNRWHQHKTSLQCGCHHNKHLQNSVNKRGLDNFKFKVLLFCDPENLILFEQMLINSLSPKYNKRLIADSNRGIKRSEKYKNDCRVRNLGKTLSEETKKKLSERLRGNTYGLGVVQSEETRNKKRLSMIGKNLGKKPSASCRQAVSISNKTRGVSDETKKRMSIAHMGKHLSEEAKKKISGFRKAYYADKRGEDGRS